MSSYFVTGSLLSIPHNLVDMSEHFTRLCLMLNLIITFTICLILALPLKRLGIGWHMGMNDALGSQLTAIEERWEKRYQAFDERLNLKGNIIDSKRHLDFGCGFGSFARILAEKYPDVQVYGIDVDKGKIEIGKKRYRLPNLHLLHSKVMIGRYDSITSLFTLHEIADVRKALDDLHRHLNVNGRIMIYEFRKRGKAKYREWYVKGRREQDFGEEYRKHNRWTVREFERICVNASFKTIKIGVVGDFWLFYIGTKFVE